MSKIKTLFKLLKGNKAELRKAVFCNFSKTPFSKLLTDKAYIKRQYKAFAGEKLNLNNPQTFNEKLQWLKLYDRKPEYTKMVDKLAVKEVVSQIIGSEYVIPTIGVWNEIEDIAEPICVKVYT